jgi:hypothetical protein
MPFSKHRPRPKPKVLYWQTASSPKCQPAVCRTARVEKHCNLCQKHGGASSTHNTSECTKYEKDGTLKAEWGKKAPLKTAGKTKTVGGNAFAQMAERMAKLEKTLKKHTKTFSRKKKHHYESSSDSNSK